MMEYGELRDIIEKIGWWNMNYYDGMTEACYYYFFSSNV